MKKTRLLALASLCSVLAGMPANAQEIKDSGAKKIGGVETQVSKESPNCKNKNEFENRFDAKYIKKLLKDPYVEGVLGVLTIGGTHEGLSYFKGKPGQFYDIPARLSFTEYSRKRKALKALEEVKKIAEAEAILSNKVAKLYPAVKAFAAFLDKELVNSYKTKDFRVSKPQKLSDEQFEEIAQASKLSEEQSQKVKESVNLYVCCASNDGKAVRILAYVSKNEEQKLFSEASKVKTNKDLELFLYVFSVCSSQ